MYVIDTWRFKETNEYEIKYAGNYGAKGERRQKRTKATPEQIKKQNQRNREKRMRRLIEANFEEGDLWVTLKYPKGTRKPIQEVKEDLRKYILALRRRYKTAGAELKFIYRLEIGKQGGIHIHMIVPRIRGADTEMMLQKLWIHGRINYQNLDDGDYAELAAYIVKMPDEDVDKQLSLFEPEERKELIKYSTSRNLIRPEPERKEYKRRTVRQMVLEGPKPKEGYYIIPGSVRIGINPYTGMSFIHYREKRIERRSSG